MSPVRRRVIAILCLLPAAAAIAQSPPGRRPVDPPLPGTAGLTTYETPLHLIRTDLPPPEAREAVLRLTRMAELYRARTAGFPGRINGRLSFYLFNDLDAYHTAGGIPGSAGLYDRGSRRLLAYIYPEKNPARFTTVQHEGFHQFAHMMIGGELPAWVNEGLAEYFAEAVFTGDGYVTGGIPVARLARIRTALQNSEFKPVPEMKALSYAAWNAELTSANYDQGWALTHFLAHADNGKYQGAFNTYLNAVSRQRDESAAFKESFGDGVALEARWRQWWLAVDPRGTPAVYARATAMTMASFLARGAARAEPTPADFAAFTAAPGKYTLPLDDPDWLPPTLLTRAITAAPTFGTWTLTTDAKVPKKPPVITCTLADGTVVTATYALAGKRVASVTTDTKAPPAPPPARP